MNRDEILQGIDRTVRRVDGLLIDVLCLEDCDFSEQDLSDEAQIAWIEAIAYLKLAYAALQRARLAEMRRVEQ